MTEPPFFYTDDFMWNVMGIRDLPNTLFQYTSSESLGKILENRSLRFSRLDTVNDPEEATALDVAKAASSIFVSCWTDREVESIPMWSMYGNQFQGVRIGLPCNMFKGRKSPRVFDKGGAKTNFDEFWEIYREPPAMAMKGRYAIGPNKILYTNDDIYRNRRIKADGPNGSVHFCTYDIGMVKSEHWAYECEWRFKITAFPEEVIWPNDAFFREVTADLVRYPIKTEAVFAPLDEGSLDELVVVCGPLMSGSERKEVEALLAEYAPSASICDSEIPLRQRPGK